MPAPCRCVGGAGTSRASRCPRLSRVWAAWRCDFALLLGKLSAFLFPLPNRKSSPTICGVPCASVQVVLPTAATQSVAARAFLARVGRLGGVLLPKKKLKKNNPKYPRWGDAEGRAVPGQPSWAVVSPPPLAREGAKGKRKGAPRRLPEGGSPPKEPAALVGMGSPPPPRPPVPWPRVNMGSKESWGGEGAAVRAVTGRRGGVCEAETQQLPLRACNARAQL